MRWSLTTASFRYHLHSFQDVLQYAHDCGMQGIELWEPHIVRQEETIIGMLPLLQLYGLSIGVVSGYLNATDFTLSDDELAGQLRRKLAICHRLQAPVLRLFTGTHSGLTAGSEDWRRFFLRLERMNELAAGYRVQLAFETHPGTLLDHPDGVERLLEAIEQRGLRQVGLNFDVFHVWEFDGEPLRWLAAWYPHVRHVHFKNADRATDDFAMGNVYNPTGRLKDSSSIASGVVDTAALVRELEARGYDGFVTLEWFGEVSKAFYARELAALEAMRDVVKQSR